MDSDSYETQCSKLLFGTLQSPREVGPKKTGGPKAVWPQPKSLTSSQPATISIKKDVKDPFSELLL